MAWTEQKLDGLLTTPSARLVEDIARVEGDVMLLGAGGKMGPTLAVLCKRAFEKAGKPNRVLAVSRFSDAAASGYLQENGVETIPCDLMAPGALDALPGAPNLIYMAGKKFGTAGAEAQTWAMNAWLPSRVAERFKTSRIVAFSTGNVYPQLPLSSGGATEQVPPAPVGDYGQSSLARERMFEYAAETFGTPVAIYRLNYAVDLRYGVLYDIARQIMAGSPLSLSMAAFNCIWQGGANEAALRLLNHASPQVFRLNVTGPETASLKETALKLGGLLGKPVAFTGQEGEKALLNNAGKLFSLFGYPSVSLNTLIEWQAQWIQAGGRTLDKPTHFEEKDGKY
ncbi:NAD-dependent epimerase/dehydratase family protein [Ruminococcaceae bacterium OttesenSCG-928-A11]|nr:NAD-dependent epimerase/dehydratase family protein [Ruminococcaceae bacterium OttesenSCG-928-A11]